MCHGSAMIGPSNVNNRHFQNIPWLCDEYGNLLQHQKALGLLGKLEVSNECLILMVIKAKDTGVCSCCSPSTFYLTNYHQLCCLKGITKSRTFSIKMMSNIKISQLEHIGQ